MIWATVHVSGGLERLSPEGIEGHRQVSAPAVSWHNPVADDSGAHPRASGITGGNITRNITGASVMACRVVSAELPRSSVKINQPHLGAVGQVQTGGGYPAIDTCHAGGNCDGG
jgi:hypothetical protein